MSNHDESRLAEEKIYYFCAYFMGPDYLNTVNTYVTFEDIVNFMSLNYHRIEVDHTNVKRETSDLCPALTALK